MKPGRITLALVGLIAIKESLDSLAELLLKTAVARTCFAAVAPAQFASFLVACAASPHLWAGLACFLANFVLWMIILSRLELSVAFPATSLSYVMVPVLAVVFLHEPLGPWQLAGIAVIIAGIWLVAGEAGGKETA